MTTGLDRNASWQTRLETRWITLKPLAVAFVIGLVAGPLISSAMGWQVTSRTATRLSHESAVEQQAMICSSRARAEIADTAALGWPARREVAEKYAVMPGRTQADSDVVLACTEMLSAANN